MYMSVCKIIGTSHSSSLLVNACSIPRKSSSHHLFGFLADGTRSSVLLCGVVMQWEMRKLCIGGWPFGEGGAGGLHIHAVLGPFM